MENNGYVKIYRKLLDNPIICKDSDYFSVWIYLLLNATHTEYDTIFKNERITLKSGQLITGRRVIAEKLNIDENKVQRILKMFEKQHQIEQQTSTKNRLISILNWNEYQGERQQHEQQVNNKRTTSEQQVNTNKNDKNIKNEKNEKNIIKEKEKKETEIDKIINANFTDKEIIETIYEFIKMRKSIKKPLTTRGLELMIKKLYTLSTNIDEQIMILNNSIMNNWQGIFALKKDNFSKSNKGSFDDFKDLWEEARIKDEQTGNSSNNNTFSW